MAALRLTLQCLIAMLVLLPHVLTQAPSPSARTEMVLVAVVDTGANLEDPAFSNLLVREKNRIVAHNVVRSLQPVTDLDGHGTRILAAMAGVINHYKAQSAVRLMVVRVLDRTGFGKVETLAEGIRLAADRGARVINVSLSTEEDAAELRQAVAYAWERGALVVAAAGSGADAGVRFPAGMPEAVGVGLLGDGANPDSAAGPHVDLLVRDAALSGFPGFAPPIRSSSGAAAYVSALAAVKLSSQPMSNHALRSLLRGCAELRLRATDGSGESTTIAVVDATAFLANTCRVPNRSVPDPYLLPLWAKAASPVKLFDRLL